MADAFGSDSSLIPDSVDAYSSDRNKNRKKLHFCAVCFLLIVGGVIVIIFMEGSSSSITPSPTSPPSGSWLLNSSHIEVYKIKRITKFRSSIGIDKSYPSSSPNDTCSSMMAWFEPQTGYQPQDLTIYSPVDGKVVWIQIADGNNNGYDIGIRADINIGSFIVEIYNFETDLSKDDNLTAGQTIGYHSNLGVRSGICITNLFVNDGNGELVSIFGAMYPNVFEQYQVWNISNRNQPQINASMRHKYPLECPNGENEPIENNTNANILPNWVYLNTSSKQERQQQQQQQQKSIQTQSKSFWSFFYS